MAILQSLLVNCTLTGKQLTKQNADAAIGHLKKGLESMDYPWTNCHYPGCSHPTFRSQKQLSHHEQKEHKMSVVDNQANI